MRGSLLAGIGFLWPVVVSAQLAEPVVRRAAPTAFPLAVTASAGIGFGGVRATAFDSIGCASPDQCYSYGAGSGWNVGVELQAPLGRSFGVEVAAQVAQPSQRVCLRSQCQSPQNLWAFRGTAMLLWRFKPRAPVFFGFGGGLTHFDPAPVVGQNVTAEGQAGSMEFGGSTVIGYDFRFTERIGGRVAWRSYLLVPSSEGLPGSAEVKGLSWDNALTFGVRFQRG